jgi:hypothetical protein
LRVRQQGMLLRDRETTNLYFSAQITKCRVQRSGIPHLTKNGSDTRISSMRHHPTVACAAFCKESRMKFGDSTKPHRKSVGMGHPWSVGTENSQARFPHSFWCEPWTPGASLKRRFAVCRMSVCSRRNRSRTICRQIRTCASPSLCPRSSHKSDLLPPASVRATPAPCLCSCSAG